jgi:hypothetical protein
MNEENWPLVTDEPIDDFEKETVEDHQNSGKKLR